jgi:hypothetical protein
LTVLAPILAWTGTYLYWRGRIAGAIRTIESWSYTSWPMPRQVQDASRFLSDAQCRAIPELLDALETSTDRNVSCFLSEIVFTRVIADHGSTSTDDYSSRCTEIRIYTDTQPSARHQKLLNMKSWWKEHGTTHPWWRVWSSKCGVD